MSDEMDDEEYETSDEAQARRRFAGYLLGGLAITAIVLALLGLCYLAVGSAWQSKERNQQRQADIAKVCIQQGNIWHRGDCLIAKKAG